MRDTADAVKTAYADRIVAEPHKYVEAAEYLTAWNGTKPTKSYVEDPNARGGPQMPSGGPTAQHGPGGG